MNENNIQQLNIVSLRYLERLLKIQRTELLQLAETAGRFYNPFDIHKNGSNKWRHIDNPQRTLKDVQRRIHKQILEKGKSIIDNAKLHVNKKCIGIVDIKDCFPSTDNLKIYQVWRNYFGCGTKNASILTKLTTFQHRLPQGAPTSSLLCNYALAPIFIVIKDYVKTNRRFMAFYRYPPLYHFV